MFPFAFYSSDCPAQLYPVDPLSVQEDVRDVVQEAERLKLAEWVEIRDGRDLTKVVTKWIKENEDGVKVFILVSGGLKITTTVAAILEYVGVYQDAVICATFTKTAMAAATIATASAANVIGIGVITLFTGTSFSSTEFDKIKNMPWTVTQYPPSYVQQVFIEHPEVEKSVRQFLGKMHEAIDKSSK